MRDCHCDCDYDEGDGEMEEEEGAHTGGQASVKWDSLIVRTWEHLENGRKGERAISPAPIFPFPLSGHMPLSVFDLF